MLSSESLRLHNVVFQVSEDFHDAAKILASPMCSDDHDVLDLLATVMADLIINEESCLDFISQFGEQVVQP